MGKTIILQSFLSPDDGMEGLAWVRGEIWTTSSKEQRISRGKLGALGRYEMTSHIPSPVENPGGLAWDGRQFYVADRIKKVVLRVDPETGQATPALSLLDLKHDGHPLVFLSEGSVVTDIAWGQGHLWLSCKAGYSSSIYGIDVKAGKIMRHFKARGPEPEGVSFDAGEEYIWTVDARNREFSQFTPNGKWTEQTLSSPVARPSGLALDDQDSFWTLDRETRKVCQIKREG